ncbi:21265_t:CDS:2 [Gigaspora rosea]|nr:21265_t:CDS:2 [Gigaspora rosea]
MITSCQKEYRLDLARSRVDNLEYTISRFNTLINRTENTTEQNAMVGTRKTHDAPRQVTRDKEFSIPSLGPGRLMILQDK